MTFLVSLTIKASEATEIYPFADQPTLSWKQFEQDFRAEYSHLTIPTIIPNNLTDIHSACYCIDTHIIHINPYMALSINSLKGILLHEIGHHNYPTELRKQNHEKGNQKVNDYENRIIKSLLLPLTGVMVGNFYHILCKKPHLGLLAAYGITTGLLSPRYQIPRKILEKTVYPTYAQLPEEFAADTFANQHATMPILQARHHKYSKAGQQEQINNKVEAENRKISMWINEELSKPNPDQNKIDIFKIAQKTNSFFTDLARPTSALEKYFDYSHPTLEQRQAIIAQALKERFNSTI